MKSIRAIKADAALRVFDIGCSDITWAIVDSGIDATHPAFYRRRPDGTPEDPGEDGIVPNRVVRAYDTSRLSVLRDDDADPSDELSRTVRAGERNQTLSALGRGERIAWDTVEPLLRVSRESPDAEKELHYHGTACAGILGGNWPEAERGPLAGICPDIKLIDIRVFDAKGRSDGLSIQAALELVRYLNAIKDRLVIVGVNAGLDVPWDHANYACGQSPVCLACEELVASGVVVVAPAGNNGFSTAQGRGKTGKYGLAVGISDPGTAENVITVGATHRMATKTYGVSYFSSRGPTADGRCKPDLVAPGEKILTTGPGQEQRWIDGTGIAAAHVSGAAALLMARHPELIGNPRRIKQVLCDTATDLGRDRYFQGAGMVDIMRALQAL